MEVAPGHCCLYHGLGSRENVDYQTPLAWAPLDDWTGPVGLELSPNERHFLAARAVSAGGVEEQNTHVLCCVEVDEAGQLLPTALGPVSDLTAKAEPEGGVVIGYSYRPPPGCAQAEQFEVLSDGGSGSLDLQTPIAVIPARVDSAGAPGASQDYEAVVWADGLPAMFAVRACAVGRCGPIGPTVTVLAPVPPAPAVLP